jgi:hypothetical protein
MSRRAGSPAESVELWLFRERPGVRRGEPVRFGVPWAPGTLTDAGRLRLIAPSGSSWPLDATVIERWPDGSVRWVLCDARVTIDSGPAAPARCHLTVTEEGEDGIAGVTTVDAGDSVLVRTGAAELRVGRVGGRFELAVVGPRQGPVTRLHCVGPVGSGMPDVVMRLATRPGALRTEVVATGRFVDQPHLQYSVRCAFFRGLATVAVDFAVTNSRRAAHPAGFWDLGDAGSVQMQALGLVTTLAEPASRAELSCEPGDPLVETEVPFSIYQESSGGDSWRSSTHRTSDGTVPMRFRGYRVRRGQQEAARSGLRATPIVCVYDHHGSPTAGVFAATVPCFWQEFPKDIEVSADRVSVGLLSGLFPALHELQGGERKTHRCVLAFGPDEVTETPLEWCRDPIVIGASSQHYVEARAVPDMLPAAEDDPRYAALVCSAVDGPDTFLDKRERADEYGWRHYGDVYADHEATRHGGEAPLISHYNNQYDAIAGFAIQFMRCRDPRWWRLLDDLARHVADIDIYHTDQDKAAYNGGLFWHTYHYVDADRSTHRCYSRHSAPSGGGPSPEHNYTSGLLLHYLLTGEESSRDAVIGLADWVLRMDDGRRSFLRWISKQPTGFATATVSMDYQGPGRGAANSINALLDAHRLSGHRSYLSKAEELIRRCIHPLDDIAARSLLDAERRWSYTVFLQLLGKYLDYKLTLGETDQMYAYAQASLVAYASWMVDHEYPFLQQPDKLEYPTETWAAQDLRKSEVFRLAARHSPADRLRFTERSRYFYDTSIATLAAAPTRTLARPVILLMTNGFQHATLRRRPESAAPVLPWQGGDQPQRFVPQWKIAVRRLVAAAIGLVTLALLGVVALAF